MVCGILVPPPGFEPRAMAVKAQSLNHWTAAEFPAAIFPKLFFLCFVLFCFVFLAVSGVVALGIFIDACGIFRCGVQGLSLRHMLFVVVHGLLSLVVACRVFFFSLSSCGTRVPECVGSVVGGTRALSLRRAGLVALWHMGS